MIRVVFDTNILISALLSVGSPPFLCLDLAKRDLIQSITCRDILDEFHEKLRTKFCYSSDRATTACQDFRQYSEIINITNQLQVVEQDSDDDMIIECAVLGKADYIVTGDRHLLSMQSYQNIIILKAREFLDHRELF